MSPALFAVPSIYLFYVCATAIWNIFFHPLRHIPGPKLWIAFPILRHISALRGRLDIDTRELHAKFGEAVRLSPNSVSFTTAQAWKDIYGHGHKQLPKVLSSASNRDDIISANDTDHTRFRKALSHAFSAKGLQAQEPLINGYVDRLIQRLKGFAESGLPLDMVKWYNLTTFDLIGDLAFGEPFGGLETSTYHHWVSTVFDFVKVIPFLKARDSYPIFCSMLLAFIPKSFLEARERQIEHVGTTVQKRLRNPPAHDRADFMDSMLRHRGEKDGLSKSELEANANILIIAGSETTATLLSGVTFWLLKSPDAMEKAVQEVRTTMASEADITFNNVTTRLPYMMACLSEAFRMYPPVPGDLQRMTLDPSVISGYKVPAKTKVSVHQSSAYISPTNFHAPDRFIPERWFPEVKTDPSSPFFADQRDVLQPFSVGPRNCIGKNLAYTEMRVILARVLWNFDLELQAESLHWNQQKTYTLWEKLPLMCKLIPRVME
ncbi:cytochrome P450 [Aspergillus affinis]|uniref:cytochrome P450 n=1 Tax=Aspergillus affinis TaxID=1070780 RepID=UPI0022FE868D|nr:uncharacterized protein KD926_004893 [Aspergillus affinis]KAI9042828.1 hypothetical protein KD926_004893 [Aspergillus affinis]